MFCTVIGIFPPEPSHWKLARTRVLSVNGSTLKWTNSYRLAPDIDKPNSPLTLIATVFCKEPANPSDLVSKVQAAFADSDVECEQWASAPAPLPLSPIGGYDGIDNDVDGDNEDIQTETMGFAKDIMKKWGLFRQNRILSSEQVLQLSDLICTSIDIMERNIAQHHPKLTIGKDSFLFREIASRSLERFDLRVETDSEVGLLVHDWIWKQPLVQELLSHALQVPVGHIEKDVNHDISIVYSKPGACHQGWHADGNHIAGKPDAGWEELGYQDRLADAHCICLFIPLINLNEKVGFTQFWPGSHRSRDLMGFGKVAELTTSTWDGICNAGDSVWYDYRLMHRGMPNISRDTVRPVIQVIFKNKWHVGRDDYNFGTRSVFEGSGGLMDEHAAMIA